MINVSSLYFCALLASRKRFSRKKNKLRLVKRSPKLNFYQPDDHNLLELVFDGNNSTGIKADVELPEKIYDSQASQSS